MLVRKCTGVSVTDLLPAGLSWISDNSGGAYNHVTGLWTIGNLNVGCVALLNISALINGTGSMTNIANGSGQIVTIGTLLITMVVLL